MADNVGSIFISLGLSLSELETDLVAANRTVNENVRRLNREADLIQLRAEVEIAGLDEIADAERILEIRQNALNEQMTVQRDRVSLLDAEYRHLVATLGEEAVATQRAQIRLERERLALANLGRDLRELNDTTGETNDTFGELSNLLPPIPTKLQAIGLAATAVTAGFTAAAEAVTNLMENFRELEKQSYELNMSVPDTENFLRQVKLGGGDIGDFEGYIRGITDAYVKGEYDDPEFIALRKYGAEIVDATGKLKDFKDITDEVFKAWEKADAAGEGIEFLQLTGGEAGVRDAIQLFKRLKEAKEDAAKIYDANLDADELHKLERSMNLVTEQADELKDAIGNIFVPAAQAAADKFFEVLHDGTQTLVENKDEIQRWGFVVTETFSTVAEKWRELTSYPTQYNTGDKDLDKAFNWMDWHASEFNDQSLLGSNSLVREAYSEFFGDIVKYFGITERAEEAQRKYNEEFSKTEKVSAAVREAFANNGVSVETFSGELSEAKTVAETVARGIASLSDSVKDGGNVLSQYGMQRVKEFKDELEDLRIELDFGDNDYEKALAQLDLWRQRELDDKLFVSEDERIAVEELYAAKSEQIEQERADKLAEIREQIASADRTAFENKLADIEKEKQSWIQAGMDKLEADALAQKKREQLEQEVADKVAEIRKSINAEFQTDLQNQIDKIQEEQQAWIEMGVSAAEAAELAGQKMEQAFQNAVDKAKSLNQSLEDKIFAQEHSQYETDLRKLQQEVAQKAQEYQKAGLFDANARALLNRYYNNALRDLNAKAGKGGDYTKSPTNSGGFQFIDYTQAQQQQIIGLFTKENTARQSVINSLTEEQRERLNANESLRKIIDAQNSFVTSTEKAADNIQDASSIEIIHGDRMDGGATASLDDILAEVTPKTELQQFGEQLKQISEALPQEEIQEFSTATKDASDEQINFIGTTKGSIEVTKSAAEATKDAADAHEKFSEMAIKARDALENFSEGVKKTDLDDAKKSGVRPEKIQFQSAPKDKSFLSVSDLGFDYDTAKDIFLTGAGIAASSAGTGIGVTFSPEIIAAAVVAALGSGVIKGTYDNRDERLNSSENLSTGKSAKVDFSEIVSPLSGVDETAKSILSELQARNTTEAEKSNASVIENLRETLSPILTNINTPLSEKLSAINDRQIEMPTIEFPTEVIVEPLNTISGFVERILDALSNREPPKVEVSPNMNIDLGGAYVFDDALKRELVDDITSNIVTRITEAVQKATSTRSNSYGFGG